MGINILITLVLLMAMIPLTYVIGRGGGRRGGYHRRSGYHSGYRGRHGRYGYRRRGGYWGYNNAAWAVPLAIGTAAAIGSAAAASSDNNYNDAVYYPENYGEDTQTKSALQTVTDA